MLYKPRGGSPGAEHDGEFVEDKGGVLDEDGVGEVVGGGGAENADAEGFQGLFILGVLGAGAGDIDGDTIEVGEFAIRERAADMAGDGGEHGAGGQRHGGR